MIVGPVAAVVYTVCGQNLLTDHTDTLLRRKVIAMAHRGRYDAEQLMGMLSEVDSDDAVDVPHEPMCPGSDDEFPCSDSDDNR